MRTLLILSISLFLFSCVNTKKTGEVYLPARQEYFKRTYNGDITNPKDSIINIKLINPKRAKVTLPAAATDFLKIQFTESIAPTDLSVTSSRLATGNDPSAFGNYVPEFSLTVPNGVNNNQSFTSPQKFRYIEFKKALQALSIPLKFRPGIRDTIPNSASAAFNVGFAYAFKFTEFNYKRLYWNDNGSAKPLGHLTNKFTYAFGPFIGPTIVELKSANTDGKVKKDRSVAALTLGGFFVFGVNEFNAGLAFGIDKTFGDQAGTWMYSGKPWLGVIVAIDIIK